MKKILSVLILISLILVGCGKKDNQVQQDPVQPQESARVEEEKVENKIEVEQEKEVPVDTEFSKLDNKKYGWGFKRSTNNEVPGFDSKTKSLMEKYGAIYLADTSKKTIYLTFDEGYENGYTAQILDVLKANNVKAAFFITGPYLKKEADLVKRMVDEGHTVGNHTINHPSMPSVTDDKKLEEEILQLDRMFYEKYGKHMKYIRPPMGEYSERTLALSKSLGYTSVFWSFAYKDWEVDNQKGTDYARETVLKGIHPGAVILLHAVSKDNANALDSIIKGAREMGYEFGEF